MSGKISKSSITKQLQTDATFAVNGSFESAREKKKLEQAVSLMVQSSTSPTRRSTDSSESPSKKRKTKDKGSKAMKKAETADVQVVEELMGRRVQGGVTMYLCRWQGLDSAYDSWEPAENIFCRAQIDEFESST